ncbi:hypothetical protein E2C01_096053 [Portunus trituberculatus]|uniref:Uncharacterized protein n=1 Tax=Portunus trituberculatus TaxID=210409 RepID=A0A5B7JRN3_PORTR|nr:hypothetical protein [Portunus trituberculatus]
MQHPVQEKTAVGVTEKYRGPGRGFVISPKYKTTLVKSACLVLYGRWLPYTLQGNVWGITSAFL